MTTNMNLRDEPTDAELASEIQTALENLRAAIRKAQTKGMTIVMPPLVHLYLDNGSLTGGWAEWNVYRRYTGRKK